MRALTILVVVMGIILLAGTGLLGLRLFHQAAAPVQRAPAKIPETTIHLPRDATVQRIIETEHRIIVHTSIPGGDDQLYFLDARSGEHKATAHLNRGGN